MIAKLLAWSAIIILTATLWVQEVTDEVHWATVPAYGTYRTPAIIVSVLLFGVACMLHGAKHSELQHMEMD